MSTSNSWAKIIMLHCGNKQEGFNAFYRLLDEFQNRDKSKDGDWVDDLKRKQATKNQQELVTGS
jgi:hypothetical protein